MTDKKDIVVDWATLQKFPEPTVYCKCGAVYRTRTKLVNHGGTLVHVSQQPCPQCGEHIDHQRRVSHDAETVVVGSAIVQESQATAKTSELTVELPEPDCGLGVHRWAYSKAALLDFAQKYARETQTNSAQVLDRSKQEYWKVRVDCYYEMSLCAEDSPKRETRWFVVEAETSDEAFTRAKEHAGATAAFGPKLIGLEAMSASRETLPLEVKG